jgi:hypothetical protein
MVDLVKLEKTIEENDSSFCGEVRGMTVSQLKDVLALVSMQRESVVKAKEDDEELISLKAQVKEISAPYRESLKKLQDKIKFIVGTMEEKKDIEVTNV